MKFTDLPKFESTTRLFIASHDIHQEILDAAQPTTVVVGGIELRENRYLPDATVLCIGSKGEILSILKRSKDKWTVINVPEEERWHFDAWRNAHHDNMPEARSWDMRPQDSINLLRGSRY